MASDNFNRADEFPLAAPWIAQFGTATIDLIGNELVANSLGDKLYYYEGAATSRHQYAECRVSEGSTDGGPAVRIGGYHLGLLNGYIVTGFNSPLPAEFGKFSNGTYTNLGSVGAAVNDGDLVRLEVEDDTLRAYINGVQTPNTVTDSAANKVGHCGKGAGVFLYTSAGGVDTLDDWQGGNLAVADTPVLTHGDIVLDFSLELDGPNWWLWTPGVIPAGMLIVLVTACWSGSGAYDLLDVTDSVGNTWNVVLPLEQNPGDLAMTSVVAWSLLENDLPNGASINTEWSASSYTSFAIFATCYSGVAPVSPLDQTGTAQDNAFPPTDVVTSSSETTTQAEELLVHCVAVNDDITVNHSDGWRKSGQQIHPPGGPGPLTVYMEDVVARTIGTYNASPRLTVASYWNSHFLTFKLQTLQSMSFPITSNDNDASGYYLGGGGTFHTDSEFPGIWAEHNYDAGGTLVDVVVLRWDTSSLPAGAVPVDGELNMYVKDRNNADSASAYLVGSYYDYGGSPIVAADWIENTDFADWIIGPRDPDVIDDAINTFDIYDPTGINPSGYTGIRLTVNCEISPTGLNYIEFADYEDATNPAPELVVYYYLPEEEEVATAYRLVPPFIR